MTALQAIVLALVQGVTELFPISSLGHAVILPALLHWNIDENAEGFLPFLVVMHLGTALALIAYFWRDWLDFAPRGAHPARTEGAGRAAALLPGGRRHHPGGHRRLRVREAAAARFRLAEARGGLPDRQRRDAVRRRALRGQGDTIPLGRLGWGRRW